MAGTPPIAAASDTLERTKRAGYRCEAREAWQPDKPSSEDAGNEHQNSVK